MKILFYGLLGLIFLGLLFGGMRAIGEGGTEGAVSSEARMPYAKVLPGHPFYSLKELGRNFREFLSFGDVAKVRAHIRSSRERLGEMYGLLRSKAAPEDIRETAEAYHEDIKTIAKHAAVSEKKADAVFLEILETGFYQTRVLRRIMGEFPKSAETLLPLEEEAFVALGRVLDASSPSVSFENEEFTKSPLPAIGFFERVLSNAHTPEAKARVLSFEEKIISDVVGRYIAGEFRAGAFLNYFQETKEDAFSTLRALDVLQSAFREDELGNQLQFLRQEFLKNPRVLYGLSMERADKEIQHIEEILKMFSNETEAKFTHERALEFYVAGLPERALAQASLSLSLLEEALSDRFFSEDKAKEEAYALRERFGGLKKDFFDSKKLDSRTEYVLKEAEKGIAELLVRVGKNEPPSSSLFSRVRSLMVALEAMLKK